MTGEALKPVSVVAALTESLRARVLSGELAPGSALREVELANFYDVARPTVRTALQALVHEGLLRAQHSRSVVVEELTAADVVDIYTVRTALEVYAVEKVIADALTPTAALAAVVKLESYTTKTAWAKIVDQDLAFHQALIEVLNSPRLSRCYAMLVTEIRLCIAQLKPVYPKPSELAEEHRMVYECIVKGDCAEARKLLIAHLEAGKLDLLRQASGSQSAATHP